MAYRAFLINMNKNPDRLAFMGGQLQHLGIPFIRQEGVDGMMYDFSRIYDEALSRKKNGAPLAKAEQGCALSHRLIWETIAAGNETGLVLEDDVELASEFADAVHAELSKNEVEHTWEYLSFNYPSPGMKFIRLWLSMARMAYDERSGFTRFIFALTCAIKFPFLAAMALLEGMRDAWYRTHHTGGARMFYRPIYLAGAYLLTPEGARKLLAVSEKIVYPADRVPNIARIEQGLRMRWYVPLLARQRRDKFHSTMYTGREYDFERHG